MEYLREHHTTDNPRKPSIQVHASGGFAVGMLQVDDNRPVDVESERNGGQRIADVEGANPSCDESTLRHWFTDTVADRERHGAERLLDTEFRSQYIRERKPDWLRQDIDE